ncbi:TIGR03619 family F420-dependent LLM class oxidoreductase [Actinomadura sp. 9N407]|uniref:TIGR03619 family F420-dependent LLM class oxidoreductase n=1 Tax=Actinomadura sp. 9N407 TaxID=3375154 RepID=UPI00379E4ADB
MAPSLGLFGLNSQACAEPAGAARVAALAERLGYDSLWTGDHVVVPSPHVPPSPLDPDEPFLDPLIALAHLAGHTERIALGTGCVVLPQRNPLVLAKQLASLDAISSGRLVFGLAVGYLEPELRAVGVPMEGRGERAEEYLKAMLSLWYDDEPAFHGRYVDFAGVAARPRPGGRPIPVVVGGHSAPALRRAVRYGDGWYGWRLDLRTAAGVLDGLRALAEEEGRDVLPHVSVTPRRRPDADAVRAYAELGVDRLILLPPPDLTVDELEAFVTDHAPERIGARHAEDRAVPMTAERA